MEKILIINNDNDTMSLLKLWLEKRTYKVKYTSSGENVVKLMEDFKPQLVLVDVLQKKAVEDIKNNGESSKIPVILMTGYTLRGDAVKIHANDVIEKPFDLPLLQQKIKKLI